MYAINNKKKHNLNKQPLYIQNPLYLTLKKKHLEIPVGYNNREIDIFALAY